MSNLAIEQAVRLGDQLIKDGLISPDQLAEALARQRSTGKRLLRSRRYGGLPLQYG